MQRTRSRKHTSAATFHILIVLATSCAALALVVLSIRQVTQPDIISPIAEAAGPSPTSTPTPTPGQRTAAGLTAVIEPILTDTQGTYAVVVKQLPAGITYTRNEHRKFAAASLYKLWIMATAFRQIQNGMLDGQSMLREDIATLNRIYNIDPAAAELSSGTVSLRINEALSQMITISHNYAALALSKKIQLANVRTFLQDTGLTESSLGEPPQITAYDAAAFMEKLYAGHIADTEYTASMTALLKQQKLNHKLPKYLPEGTIVAHKTGELGAVTHDVGIVYGPRTTYVIAVLSESNTPALAEDVIARISEAVYGFFSR